MTTSITFPDSGHKTKLKLFFKLKLILKKLYWIATQEFKELVRSGIRRKEGDSGVPEDEENFEEALQAVNTSLNPTRVPSEVADILADEKCGSLTAKSDNFWFICRAVRDFVEAQGTRSFGWSGNVGLYFVNWFSSFYFLGYNLRYASFS